MAILGVLPITYTGLIKLKNRITIHYKNCFDNNNILWITWHADCAIYYLQMYFENQLSVWYTFIFYLMNLFPLFVYLFFGGDSRYIQRCQRLQETFDYRDWLIL